MQVKRFGDFTIETYVLEFNINGQKKYYFANSSEDIRNAGLVSDPNDARIFTRKQAEPLRTAFKYKSKLEDLDTEEYVEILELPKFLRLS